MLAASYLRGEIDVASHKNQKGRAWPRYTVEFLTLLSFSKQSSETIAQAFWKRKIVHLSIKIQGEIFPGAFFFLAEVSLGQKQRMQIDTKLYGIALSPLEIYEMILIKSSFARLLNLKLNAWKKSLRTVCFRKLLLFILDLLSPTHFKAFLYVLHHLTEGKTMVYSRAKHRHIFFVLLIESGKLKKKKEKGGESLHLQGIDFSKAFNDSKGNFRQVYRNKISPIEWEKKKMFQSNR